FLDGLPLTKLMGKPMDSMVAIPILVQVCRALEAAHRRGVIHRDLKPDNIFLVPRRGGIPRVKLLDFGLATHMSVDGVPPGDGAVGTARFMAPEQWEGRALDVRTDLYALGVIAFGLATGQPPFTERNEDDLRWAHCFWPAPDPRTVCAGVSEPWAQVIRKALSKDPKDRYQSGREMSQALEAALEEEGPTLLGVPLAEPSQVTPLFDSVDPEVERVLARYRGLPDGDPYAALDLPEGARTGEVWLTGAKRLSELSALSDKRLPPELRDEVSRARARVLRALCQLGLPHRRIARDAAAGNLAGVARCIAAMGRSATLALRQAKPLPRDAARLARRYRKLGEAWTRRGQSQRALHAFERALKQDPLDLEAHRQYWALRREALQGRGPEGEPS
ncbi:MAG TPA: protein kinase, partial [Longimicrobium sp.]|nr:protein kinase [Longimicrobium sp.]